MALGPACQYSSVDASIVGVTLNHQAGAELNKKKVEEHTKSLCLEEKNLPPTNTIHPIILSMDIHVGCHVRLHTVRSVG